MVAVVVVAAAVAGFASMEDAEFGVVGIASAGDGWGVAAASTWVAGSAVAEVAVPVGVVCALREVVELGVAAAAGFGTDGVDEDCAVVVGGFVAVAAG